MPIILQECLKNMILVFCSHSFKKETIVIVVDLLVVFSVEAIVIGLEDVFLVAAVLTVVVVSGSSVAIVEKMQVKTNLKFLE